MSLKRQLRRNHRNRPNRPRAVVLNSEELAIRYECAVDELEPILQNLGIRYYKDSAQNIWVSERCAPKQMPDKFV